MKKVFSIFMASFFAFTNVVWAAAEKPAKTESSATHESIVLLPVKGAGLTEAELSIHRDSLAEGLGTHYTVKFGEQVDKIIKEVFEAESRENLECDETRCYKDLAAALNVQLVAKASVFKSNEDFQLSLVIYNVLENRAEETKTDFCTKCNSIDLSRKLKAMASGEAATAVAEEKKGTSWYWYLLGALAVGAAAAGAGGKGGGGGGPSAPSPGNVSVSW